jgi:hypothetical protein
VNSPKAVCGIACDDVFDSVERINAFGALEDSLDSVERFGICWRLGDLSETVAHFSGV